MSSPIIGQSYLKPM